MSNERKRQKKREEKKKKREAIKTKNRKQQLGLPTSVQGAIRHAVSYPFGPTFVSAGWNVTEGQSELSLVTVVVTRVLPDKRLVPGVALVDRTCLGIKNGFAQPPMTVSEFARLVDKIGLSYPAPMEPCDLLVGQSIVFHALEYARSLGFVPHPDFPAPLFGPRPEVLMDTPYARPEKPMYFAGPDDDVPRIMAQLERAVGPGNYTWGVGSAQLELAEDELDEDEGDFVEDEVDDEEGDDDEGDDEKR